ncbi:lipid-A-disaccharide synthase [Xanthocytophaga flava]|uniref:lipid-A-disaccharide synthase n=1 Tax=Xanthocytophaga flava TaxID=3048013 RepID=UPI0028D2EC32|nr:lipid-A-disaccharide synthase [Xanthocytophaga flavus]MDJ1468797.1 lipid-A-disaccharide synthase [Xanthocytophaga flavus]
MKYYVIAGERSGDLHAANLIKAIAQEDKQAEFRGWGGEQMEEAGAYLVTHYRNMAFMGFWEVIKNLTTIRKFIKKCQEDILLWKPDVVILVDYAGFNMRIAKFCKQHTIQVFYYISPKVWAWNQSRAYKIKATVDRLFVILPFEKEFFKKYEYDVDYVGNPLLDEIDAFKPQSDFLVKNNLSEKSVIALLPGSRYQEVEKMLSVMLDAAQLLNKEKNRQYQFIIAGVSNLPKALYEDKIATLEKELNVSVIYNQSYDLLSVATAAWVTSGTATLETALFHVPQVVCYRTSAFTYQIVRVLIKVKYISLVNLIANEPVVVELIQSELTPQKAFNELTKLLPGEKGRQSQLEGYNKVDKLMGEPGASQRTARLMMKYLTSSTQSQ